MRNSSISSLPDKNHILIVEDSYVQALKLKQLLEYNRYQVSLATNGKEALDAARSQEFTLIISDVLMPEMDGYELCAAIKADADLKETPVILLTSLTDSHDIIRGLQAGADNFLTKPYNDRYLLTHIHHLLANRELRKEGKEEMSLDIMFKGNRFTINSERQQILDLLLSVYETAVEKNSELIQTHKDLQILNDELEQRVQDRTAALNAEITERKNSEEMLRNQKEFLEIMINTIPAPIYYKDIQGVYQGCNAKYASMMIGLPKEQILGRTILDLKKAGPPDLARIHHEQDIDLINIPGSRVYMEDILCPDAKLRHFVISKSSYTDAHGRVSGMVGIMMDITERKMAEQDLKRSEQNLAMRNKINEIFLAFPCQEMYGSILKFILDMTRSRYGLIGYIDQDMNMVVSSLIGDDTGHDCIVGNKSALFSSGTYYETIFGQVITGRRSEYSNKPRVVPEGHVIINSVLVVPVVFQKRSIGVIAVANKTSGYGEQDKNLLESIANHVAPILNARLQQEREESARKQAEEEKRSLESQLIQAQKMESIGTLTGGIAHDFNNMLSPILGYADIILGEMKPDAPNYQEILHIRNAAERAKDLIWQLLAFSRKQVLEKKNVDLRDMVSESQKILRRTVRENVNIKVVPSETPKRICADPGMMLQILLNLAVNAQDAMPQGGIITIETMDSYLDEAYIEMHPEARAGEYVMLCFSDNGCGMDAQTRKRIFEPFFTTKELGKGTGLGLSTVYGIVKQHGGHISVYSEPGMGTTFKVYLPKAEGIPAEIAARKAERREIKPGSETVLVVEDEEVVREMTCRFLIKHGYTVVSASCAEECLNAVKQHEGPIHLLLTDVVMPGMNGKQLYETLAPSLPGLKAIFISGYTHDVITQHGVLLPGVNLIHKPFTVKDLTDKVRSVLDG